MPEFTITQLTALLRECAGEDESVDLDGDILDTTFEDLGYDSLALFNTVIRIERDYSVVLSDDLISEAKTPRDLIDRINESVGKHA